MFPSTDGGSKFGLESKLESESELEEIREAGVDVIRTALGRKSRAAEKVKQKMEEVERWNLGRGGEKGWSDDKDFVGLTH